MHLEHLLLLPQQCFVGQLTPQLVLFDCHWAGVVVVVCDDDRAVISGAVADRILPDPFAHSSDLFFIFIVEFEKLLFLYKLTNILRLLLLVMLHLLNSC